MRIAVIDNYDSFTYNLVQLLPGLGANAQVMRNDSPEIDVLLEDRPDGIIISPGPKGPAEAGRSVEVIRHFAGRVPILGVCLGHQAVAFAFGAAIKRAARPMHGKTSPVSHDGRGCFTALPEPFEAGRYHSLVVDRESLPDCLEVSATADDGEIMGIRHREMPIEGLQFHPESVLTPQGRRIVKNFIDTYCVKGEEG